jgi:hypothetical protein
MSVEHEEDIPNEHEDVVKNVQSKKRKKKNKFVELELQDEDYLILDTDFDKLRELVISNIQYKIEEIETKIDEINADERIEDKKTAKKYYIAKLKKFKKDLTSEDIIKKRTKLYGVRKRKLSKIAVKVQDKIEKVRKQKLRCFKCRKRGHTVAECKSQENESDTLCYNCGSKEHSLAGCDKKVDYKHLPFAECFICKEQGHISANCPASDKGIFPRGGCCFICKEKDHLAKNCPQKQMEVVEVKKDKLLSQKKKRTNK